MSHKNNISRQEYKHDFCLNCNSNKVTQLESGKQNMSREKEGEKK